MRARSKKAWAPIQDPVVTPPTIPTKAIPGVTLVRYISTDGAQADMPTYETIFLTGSRLADLAYVKGISPSTRVLAYADMTVLTSGGTDPTAPGFNSPVSLLEAQNWDASHPNDKWILYDAAVGGNAIPARGYPNDRLANLGSITYQQRVVQRMQATIASGSPDFDGVMLDEVNSIYLYRSGSVSPYNVMGYATPPNGSSSTKSAVTDAVWRTNMIAMLAYIHTHLGDTGLPHYINVNGAYPGDNDGSQTSSWWDAIYPSVDGLGMEFFACYAGQSPPPLYYNAPADIKGYYDPMLQVVDTAQGHGKDFIGGGHGPADATRMMYVKSAFLLKWNGVPGGGMYWMGAGAGTLNSAYTTWIGTPLGLMSAVSPGGWMRKYTNGIVIVNPNAPGGSNISFTLGGNYYPPGSSTAVSSVTLTPVTSMILTSYAP